MEAVSGNQVKPGPETRGRPHRRHGEFPRKHVRQAEQVLFVGPVAVEQDQQRLAGAFLLGMGPQDNGRGKGNVGSHGSILAVTSWSQATLAPVRGKSAGYERE
jgi:hypothetical protein